MKQIKLAKTFRSQETFASDYSLLYATLYGVWADWLEETTLSPWCQWLLSTAANRAPFDVPLLVAAGVHRLILAAEESAARLAAFYPTAGGQKSVERSLFAQALADVVWHNRESLAPFIQTATVQTNESGRGFAWLWPLHFVPWTAVHLIDLGASAGLNLVADQRAYRLLAANGQPLHDVGAAWPVQFVVESQNDFPETPLVSALPEIRARTGCDIAPFHLSDETAALTLASFIWGDQVTRMTRLQEGMSALARVNAGPTAVSLHQVTLPADLPKFLEQQGTLTQATPTLLYNTYMTIYLEDRGQTMRERIGHWASQQPAPVLWLQWEPYWGGPEPPHFGWCAWTADWWQDGNHHFFHLAWVHPHGTQVMWLPGWLAFVDQLQAS